MVPDDSAVDATADSATAEPDEESGEQWEPDRPTRVDENTVVVPMRMYKGITVFSTLTAVVLVVLGFFLFDAATQAGNPIRQFVVWLAGLIGLGPASGVLNVGFGLAGIASILLGAGAYVLGTRFKTSDMLSDSDRSTAADADDDTVEDEKA